MNTLTVLLYSNHPLYIQVLNNTHTPTFCPIPSDPLKLLGSYQSHLPNFSLSFRASFFNLCHIVSKFIPLCPLVLSVYEIKEEVCILSVMFCGSSLVPVIAVQMCSAICKVSRGGNVTDKHAVTL